MSPFVLVLSCLLLIYVLNAIRSRPISPGDVRAALSGAASGPVTEGSVGAVSSLGGSVEALPVAEVLAILRAHRVALTR